MLEIEKEYLKKSEDALEEASKSVKMFMCNICETNVKKKYYDPCGHGICPTCYDLISDSYKCHICRAYITKTITLFID